MWILGAWSWKNENESCRKVGLFFSDKLFWLLSLIDKSGVAADNYRLNDVVSFSVVAHVPIFGASKLLSAASSPLHPNFQFVELAFAVNFHEGEAVVLTITDKTKLSTEPGCRQRELRLHGLHRLHKPLRVLNLCTRQLGTQRRRSRLPMLIN